MPSHVSPQNHHYIKQVVRSGAYRDEREALDEAVELLKKRDQLRREIQAGIDQADRGELIPAEKVFERLEKRAQDIERRTRATE